MTDFRSNPPQVASFVQGGSARWTASGSLWITCRSMAAAPLVWQAPGSHSWSPERLMPIREYLRRRECGLFPHFKWCDEVYAQGRVLSPLHGRELH